MRTIGYITGSKTRAVDNEVRYVTAQLGGAVRDKGDAVDCDLAIVWGWKEDRPNMQFCIERGIPILCLEQICWRAVDHVKGDAFSLGFNGLQGGAFVPEAPRTDRYRPKLKPWRDPREGQITIFGQVSQDAALRGSDNVEWCQYAQTLLKAAHPDRDVVVRKHPLMLNSWDQHKMEPLQECLDKTGIAVTYSSTVGSEAVIEGIPTIAMHWGSLAAEVTSHSLRDALVTPNRERWMHDLSWRHWGVHEQINVGWLMSGYEEALDRARSGIYDKTN